MMGAKILTECKSSIHSSHTDPVEIGNFTNSMKVFFYAIINTLRSVKKE